MDSFTIATDTEKKILDLKTFYEIALINRPFFTSYDIINCDAVMSEIDTALSACRSVNLKLTTQKLSLARGLFENYILKIYKHPHTGTDWKVHYWQAVKLGMMAKLDQCLKDIDTALRLWCDTPRNARIVDAD